MASRFSRHAEMLKELDAHPESECLGHSGLGRVIVQYWRSFEHLEAYARAKDKKHWPAWVDFKRRVGSDVASQSGLKAGVFSTESEGVVLTKEGECCSRWLLAEEFESLFLERGLSYQSDAERWHREGTRIGLQTVSPGQEFVLDGKRHPAVYKYSVDRIKATAAKIRRCSHDF